MAQEQQREELLIRDRVTGQPRPYYVDAKNINLGDDETYKSLPDVLDEMQDDIDDAKEHGGGSVTGVKVGDTTYDPDQQGVVDISPAIPDVSGKANKSEMSVVPGTGANADKTTITLKEGTSATVLTQHQDISMKANSSEVVKGIKDSNGNPLPKNQDGTITLPAVQAGDKVSVIQPDPADGTFTIRVGSDDFTVNLNHTHPNMAKLIVCEESDLPSTLDPATIYAITDSGETEIEKLIIRGMEFAGGGGAPSTDPRITSPIGTQIDFNSESTKTITVRATNLSESLTIAVTGVTANLQTISASDAENGVQLTLTKGQNFDGGTLRIYSSEVDKSWTVIDSQAYHPIAAVKLTGTQWLQTDYCPGPDTEFSMKCKFTENSNTNQTGYGYQYGYFLCCPYDGNYRFSFLNGVAGTNPSTVISYIDNNTENQGGDSTQLRVESDFTEDNSYLNLTKGTSANTLTFLAGGVTSHSVSVPLKTTTMSQPMAIGYLFSQSAIYGVYDLTIYELIISENGVERRHYVPKTFNGVPGLYDTVTNTFISSETNDELVAIPLT